VTVRGVRRALQLAVAAAVVASGGLASAASESPSATPPGGLIHLGQVGVPVCAAGGFATDPTQALLLDVMQTGSCSANTPVASGTWLYLVDERSLRPVGMLPMQLPGYAPVYGGPSVVVRSAMTPRGEELFVAYVGAASRWIAVFDLVGVARRHGRLVPRLTIAVPNTVPPSTISTDDPTEFVSSGIKSNAPYFAPTPSDIAYDPVTDSLDFLERYHDPNGLNPQTSRRGNEANGVYVLEFAAKTGVERWAVQLGRCADTLSGWTSPTLLHITSAGRAVIAGGCLYSRSVTAGSGLFTKNSQSQSVQLPTGGSMMAWTIPLSGGRPANPNSPVAYFPGRTGADSVVADRDDHRLFFTTQPADGSAANTPGGAAVVFDVDHDSYVGAPTIAAPNEAGYAMAVGDGRYYSVGAHGISVGSATATPLGQPNPAWRGYACETVEVMTDPRLRLLLTIPAAGCGPGNPGAVTAGTEPLVEVFRDDTPMPAAMPPVDPDTYTTQSPTGAVQVSYGGAAAASGARVRIIGGLTGLLDGATFDGFDSVNNQLVQQQYVQGYQSDFATHEVDVGVVGGVSLSNFEASAQAAPATVDDTTQGQVQAAEGDAGNGGWQWPFDGVSCSGQGSPTKTYGPGTTSSVQCNQAANSVSASSAGEGLDILASLVQAPQRTVTPQPVAVTWGLGSSTAQLDRQLGMVSQVVAEARGVVVGPIQIADVKATATCKAHGRAGTATCSYTRTISGVGGLAAGAPTSCSQTWTATAEPNSTSCDTLLAALNAVDPGFLVVSAPAPYWAKDELRGSPGGYQSVAERNLYDHLQDGVLNYDDSKQIPGLRVLYNNDGVKNPSRIDVQLANVEAESRYGINAVSPCRSCGPGPQGTSTPSGNARGLSLGNAIARPVLATPTPPSSGGSPLSGVVQLVKHAFAGLAWLVRSPGQALLVTCMLGLLGAPMLLARRRQRLATLGTL
jgi:hypothetical protein